MSYTLQFVDRIAALPGVRLDLMAEPWGVQAATDFGMPELRRAVASTLLADGDLYPAAAYGNRVITLVVRVVDVGEDATATALQRLYRELDRPNNILMYQPATSSPVFFRTLRCGPDAVVWDPFVKEVRAIIPAEPFAYGLKETVAATAIPNNPASASGQYLDITSVPGDVDTPLRLSASVASGLTTSGRVSAVAVRRRGTPSESPYLLQAENMLTGTDTAVQPNSAVMSGAGSNSMRVSFATTTAMTTRLIATTWPSVASRDVRGTYRVLARIRKTVASDVITLQVGWGVSGGPASIFSDVVSVSLGSTDLHLVDLGQMSIPAGPDPVTDGFAGWPLNVSGQYLTLSAARGSGSGALDVDYLIALPADDRLMFVRWGQLSSAAQAVIDGTSESVYGLAAGGEVHGGTVPSQVAGGFPMLSPGVGVTNRVYFVRSVGAVDDIAASTTVTAEYWPRYLHVRPVSS